MTQYYRANILLVDDDQDDVDLFKDALYLVSPQTNFFSALSCKEGYEFLTRGTMMPDIIFMDLRMAAMGGVECIRLVKSNELYKNIPIVILSSHVPAETLEMLYDLGVNYFATKPPSFEELQFLIDKIVNVPEVFKERTKENFHFNHT